MKRSATLFLILATTACTQPSAQVDLRGQNTYGRNSSGASPSYAANYNSVPKPHSYNSSQPARGVETVPEQDASIGAVTTSDLAPPTKVEAKPLAAPVKQAAAEQPVNKWTRKPHDTAPTLTAQAESTGVYTPAAKTASKGFTWPVASHKVISGFGPKGGGKVNDGINIASGDGEPVWAAADGEVLYSGNGIKGYGNMVLIHHADGKTTTYAHMDRITVDKYDRVKQGDIIGYVGATGDVKSPQLHFAIREGKDPVDPAKFLPRSVASN